MRKWVAGVGAISVLLSTAGTVAAGDANFLEVLFDKYESAGSVFLYEILLAADKEGATTCELATLSDIYALVDVGGEFWPEQGFIDDHASMSFASFAGSISGAWTLTWDAGLPTQTVATISFGSVPETDFLLVPTLTSPVDGAPIVINPPTLEWNYGGAAPCDAQLETVEASVSDQVLPDGGIGWGSELPCSATSWTPPSLLAQGTWFSRVANSRSDYRDVPDGLVFVGDPWILDNTGWLALQSIDRSQNENPLPTESRSWGAIKALHRR